MYKSEWLQVLKSIKVGVNGRFIFFFFFEKSENIEFYFRSNVFFFSLCFAIRVRQFLMDSLFTMRKMMDLEFFFIHSTRVKFHRKKYRLNHAFENYKTFEFVHKRIY